ncbi:WxL domain-containing protein [Candidatus Enterococcus murrayae]|uniref:WxL domain-containing protein n=1 Tax=Candidatus Enterococcus murrayae TaxID=2815321 RepID=A0ABS3HD06_9ENTE|nr:WxL domain-containing protein [Enterococcus sp. MJM16]MBO0451329.1 WxL domain-containing protein [Enterococcus sp. MJM16]
MNKVFKTSMQLVIALGIILGIVVGPEANATATVNVPEKDVGIKLLAKDGSELSVPLNVSGDLTEILYTSYASPPYSLYSSASADISKPSPLVNEFSIKLPAYNRSITFGAVNGTRSIKRHLTNMKITGVNSRYIKSFDYKAGNIVSVYGEIQRNSDPPVIQAVPPVIDNYSFIKQADDTYLLNIPPFGIIDGLQYYSLWLGSSLVQEISRSYSAIIDRDFFIYSNQGDTNYYYANYQQVKEIFENTAGTAIPAPSGYTQNKLSDVTSDPFTYTMSGGNTLPKTYVIGSNIYTYQGWYKGAGNKSSIDSSYPPNISFGAEFDDAKDEVHIVYDVKAARVVTEQYIDESSAFVDPTWNGTVSVPTGSTFTQTPADPKTHSSGADWEYLGWKLSTEPMAGMRPKTTPVSQVINTNTIIQYVYRKKQHTLTEKFVDSADGTTLLGVSPNPNSVTTDDADTYTQTPASSLTDTSGDDWEYVGWENVTDAPGTVNLVTIPVSITNVKGNKEIKYHYRLKKTTATLDLTPTPQVVGSGNTVSWSTRLTNTGLTALKDLKLKATTNWAAGLSAPTKVTVTPAVGVPVDITVSPADWVGGFSLAGISIPNGGPNNYADITFTDTATGAVNQVLPAEIEIDGNMASPMTAENFVRIDDPNEPNLLPTGNAGLLNIPDFRFGETEVKPFAQTKGLDATKYQGTYDPYIRFMDQESTFGWDLTVNLSQFTSGAHSLPTTTTLRLKNGDLKEVQNYNKHNESLSSITSVGTKQIPSDGTTVALTNSATQGVYQIDYAFNDVELELLAHSGIAGLKYEADMDWTLTTAP